MCGIYGYIGQPRGAEYLVERIRSLEYRGYDSAGIAYMTPNRTWVRYHGIGDIRNVIKSKKVFPERDKFELGIAHTRWATHGVPSERNAHPHEFPDFYLVHNGIIENYQDLIETFNITQRNSDTDSEVIGWVFHTLLKKSPKADLKDLIADLRSKLSGSYACLIMFKREPKLIALRHKSPLLLGIEEVTHNVVVCSDQYGLGNFEGKLYQLNDEESLIIQKDQEPKLLGPAGTQTPKYKQVKLTVTEQQNQVQCHFLKEITEQEYVFDDTLLNYQKKHIQHTLQKLQAPKDVQIVACGSAYHASLYGKLLLDQIGTIRAEASVSSEFRYRQVPAHDNQWHIFVSQSGETADTLESARNSKATPKTKVFSITTHEENSLSRISHYNWPMKCGTEVSVAATKTFSAQLKMFALLASTFNPKISIPSSESFDRFFKTLPDLQKAMKEQARKAQKIQTLIYLGRNLLLPIALEGALKIKEICYVHAEAFPSGELKHGPLALIDKNTLSICCISKDFYPEKEMNVLNEIKSRNGNVLFLTDSKEIYAQHRTEAVLIQHDFPYAWAGIPFVIPLQLFAYEMALLKGVNIDRPRNLAKSVTVE